MNVTDSKKLAQSASSLGAGILGFGIGAKWGGEVRDFSIAIVIIGAILHICGMYIAQMKENPSTESAKILWISAWICLVAIVILFFYMLN